MDGTTERFSRLDTLRGYAAILVVILHGLAPFEMGRLVRSAALAVDFFFALSGFVIAYAYETKLQQGMTVRAFMVRRMVRLYPLLFMGVMFGLLVLLARVAVQLDRSYLPAVAKSFALGVLILPSPYLADVEHGTAWPLNVPMWSLLAEIIANWVYAAVLARRSNRVLLVVISAAFVTSTVTTYLVGDVTGGNHWYDLGLGLVRVCYPFLAGIMLCRAVQSGAAAELRVAPAVPTLLLLACLIMPLPARYAGFIHYLSVMFIFPAIIWLAATGPNARTRAKPSDFDLGVMSYALYVLHYPIIKIFSFAARRFVVQGAGVFVVVALELAVAVAVAFMANRYYDHRAQDMLKRMLVRRSAPAPVIATRST